MAVDTRNTGKQKRTVTHEATDVDFSTGAAAAITIPELRSVENVEDVSAQAYGTGDADANEGYVVRCTSVDGNSVTLHAYQGGGAGAPLDDAAVADIDHVLVTAHGY